MIVTRAAPPADARLGLVEGPGPEADDRVRHQGHRLTPGPPAVDARHQGPPLKLTIGSARSRGRGLNLTPGSAAVALCSYVTLDFAPCTCKKSAPGSGISGRYCLVRTRTRGGPEREADDRPARVRHQGHRLKLTIVLGPVEGPGLGRGPEREADARARHRGRRLTTGPPAADFHVDARHQGHRLKLTPVFGPVEGRGVFVTTGAAADARACHHGAGA